MALRIVRFGLLTLAALPLAQVSCSGGEDRKFVDADSGAGAGGATTGGAAGSGGDAGSSSGGKAGSSSGGDAGSSGGTDAGQPCSDDTECDDGNDCNGTETCDGTHCLQGSPPADGTPCALGAGDAGAGDGGAADYVCLTGTCSLKCETDSDCEDNDVCTGQEICHPTTKTCLSGTPPTCDDGSPCTENKCDPIGGCFYPVIDADGDGHADKALGTCGDDCDDSDPTVYTGAAELCDGKDNNCNGATDELAPTWYVDCDGDGFAPAGAVGMQQCQKPANVDPSCGATGSWTSKVPTAGTTDCWDKDSRAHPMTATENNTAWQSTPMSGDVPVSIDYDFNCDGQEEREELDTYASSASCSLMGLAGGFGIGAGGFTGLEPSAVGGTGGVGGGFTYCVGKEGWTTGVIPACGAPGSFSQCYYDSIAKACARRTITQVQRCR
jgi:hypothetical protein